MNKLSNILVLFILSAVVYIIIFRVTIELKLVFIYVFIVIGVFLLWNLIIYIVSNKQYQYLDKYYHAIPQYKYEKIQNKKDLKNKLLLFRYNDLSYISQYQIILDEGNFVYCEVSKSFIPLDIVINMFTRGFGRTNDLLKYFVGEYYIFNHNTDKFRFYYTNFMKEKNFIYNIEHLLRLKRNKINKHLYYINDEYNIPKELYEFIEGLNKKVVISVNKNEIHIAIENKKSILKVHFGKRLKNKIISTEENQQIVMSIYKKLIELI